MVTDKTKIFPLKGRWKEWSVVRQNKCISHLFRLNWSTEHLDAYQIMHGPLITHTRLGPALGFDTALFILWPDDCGLRHM